MPDASDRDDQARRATEAIVRLLSSFSVSREAFASAAQRVSGLYPSRDDFIRSTNTNTPDQAGA